MKNRKWIVVIMSILLLVEVGCVDNREKTKGLEAINYINAKYNKEFIPLSYDLGDYLSSKDMVECYTDGMNPAEEHVTIVIDDAGFKTVFHDNYAFFLMRDDIENTLSQIVGEHFRVFKLFVSTNVDSLPDELNYGSRLEDLYNLEKDYWISVTVFVKKEADFSNDTYAKKYEQVIDALKASQHEYTFLLMVIDEDYYQGLERYKQDDFWNEYFSTSDNDNSICVFERRDTVVNGEVI